MKISIPKDIKSLSEMLLHTLCLLMGMGERKGAAILFVCNARRVEKEIK